MKRVRRRRQVHLRHRGAGNRRLRKSARATRSVALRIARLCDLPTMTLHGDGRTPDADALEVWMNGGDVRWPSGELVGAVISGRKFLLERGICLCRPTRPPRQFLSNWLIVKPGHMENLDAG